VVFYFATVIVLGHLKIVWGLHKMVDLIIINVCVVTFVSTDNLIIYPHNLRYTYSLRHNNIEINVINNPTKASTCSSERKNFISLILNEKLQFIKLSEEGMLKAKMG
jgi:hypothetical protein